MIFLQKESGKSSSKPVVRRRWKSLKSRPTRWPKASRFYWLRWTARGGAGEAGESRLLSLKEEPHYRRKGWGPSRGDARLAASLCSSLPFPRWSFGNHDMAQTPSICTLYMSERRRRSRRSLKSPPASEVSWWSFMTLNSHCRSFYFFQIFYTISKCVGSYVGSNDNLYSHDALGSILSLRCLKNVVCRLKKRENVEALTCFFFWCSC